MGSASESWVRQTSQWIRYDIEGADGHNGSARPGDTPEPDHSNVACFLGGPGAERPLEHAAWPLLNPCSFRTAARSPGLKRGFFWLSIHVGSAAAHCFLEASWRLPGGFLEHSEY